MVLDTVTVNLKHNSKVIRSVETNLDTMHKLISVMSYGGWKPDISTKLLVDDYHFISLDPFVVDVNLMTESEIFKRNAEQAQAQYENLNQEFLDKLKPAFKRNPGDLN